MEFFYCKIMLTETEQIVDKDVQAYIDGIQLGTISACRYVKLAVQRHLKDLETGEERGLYFDPEAAQIKIDFFKLLKHSKGKWAGQEFVLEPWQKFILWVLFGWKNMDGTRRFRVAYNEVGRKNGKSTLAAGIGLVGEVVDNEQGAEIYSVATKMEQAQIIHKEAKRMVKSSPALKRYLRNYKNSIVMDSTNSSFEPLGADAKTLDGLNPHFSTVDEFHAHKSSEMWDLITSAVGSRTQPLIFAITTAGFNIHGICHDQHDYAIKVLEGAIEDDTFFAIIYTLDEGDDWKDEKVWIKANPNLGVTVDIKNMKQMCKKAQDSPSELNGFLCKKLNIWTTAEKKFFSMEYWQACNRKININDLIGKSCYEALDLSSKIDITAHCLLFSLPDDYIFADLKFFCPKDSAIQRSRDDKVSYLKWAEQGYITLTPGNVVDYSFVEASIKSAREKFDVIQIGYDPWNFESMRQNLIRAGYDAEKFIEYPQVLKNMSEPTKELDKLVRSGKLIYNNNPVLYWMAENTMVYRDPNDNIRPVKNRSSEKIDGIVALIMCIGLKLAQKIKPDIDKQLREIGI